MIKTLFYSYVSTIQDLWTEFKDDKVECAIARMFAMVVVAFTLFGIVLFCTTILLLISYPIVLFWITMPILLAYIITYGITKIKLPDEENTNGNDNIEQK